MLAHEFGFEGWRFKHPGDYPPELVPGYGERKRDIQPIDQGRAVTINAASAPLEWLMARGRLASKQDTLEGIGMLRFNTALRMREEVEGAATAGLKGQAYEGGGGGGSGRQPSDYAIDCMRMVNKIQESMHPDLYRLLIWVAVDDFWAWERAETAKEQHHVILKLHKAIDIAAVVFGYLTREAFRKRWGDFNPRWERRPKQAQFRRPAHARRSDLHDADEFAGMGSNAFFIQPQIRQCRDSRWRRANA